ncbi:hypothetical protein ACFLX5_01405 [Chloroflexota bacterium]
MSLGKAAVALSGAVDSSVAALRLMEQGYEVVGITMRLRPGGEETVSQAHNVCKILDIPFHVFDFGHEFRRYVVDYFCNEYGRGRTPNPCLPCNRRIKYGSLLREALGPGSGLSGNRSLCEDRTA